LSNSGTAIMGSATAKGENRAQEAITKALDSPLLNDNKITGAKNVLLLIVSGEHEITIDEIGEINDFIQAEAKSNVNIIMGVGEDESLGDEIAVTIVATGFHKDQQCEISNVEAKKIVHTLEDEQERVYHFSSSLPLEEEATKDDKKELANEDSLIASEKIIHTLEDKTETHAQQALLIPTTETIKNIEVNHEEVVVSVEKMDDFVITSIATKEPETTIDDDSKMQPTLIFDLPLKEKQEDVNDINVVFDVVNPSKKIEDVYFDLEEYTKLEDTLTNATKQESEVENELQFNVRVEKEASQEAISHTENSSPLNLTILELKKTAESRKEKLKSFNYKFTNKVNQNIDEIEKEPAYKRMGVDLDETHLSDVTTSRTTLSLDDNDDLQLRSNNSFLHDNVD